MNIFTKVLALLLVGTGLTSCLKDENIDDQQYGIININTNKIVEITKTSNSLALPFEDINRDVNVITLNLAAESAATEDVKVILSLAQSQTMIDAYNTENDASIVLLPADLYTLPSSGLVVTIPKGSKSVPFTIKMNTSKIDPSTTYGLGFIIGSLEKSGYVISGNFGKSFVKISAKNKYDGVYKLTGTMTDVQNTTLSGYYPLDNIWLVTTGANTVEYYDNDYGVRGHIIKTATGGASQYGSFVPVFTFDGNGAVTSVVNGYGQPAANGRGGRLDVTGINKYNAATKTLEVSYIMTQNGDRTFFTEKFVYTGSR